MAASHCRFAFTYNGPDLPSSLLEMLNVTYLETCKDSHGFMYASIQLSECMLSGAVEDVINDWNLEQPSDDTKIRLHPFHEEETIVAINGDHFITKKIDEQETEHICDRPSTYHRWVNRKRKASDEDSDETIDKYAGKSQKELKTLLSARDEWIHEKNSKIDALLEEIKSHDAELAKIEEKLRSKDDIVKAKDEVIKAKDQVIKAKDDVITHLRMS